MATCFLTHKNFPKNYPFFAILKSISMTATKLKENCHCWVCTWNQIPPSFVAWSIIEENQESWRTTQQHKRIEGGKTASAFYIPRKKKTKLPITRLSSFFGGKKLPIFWCAAKKQYVSDLESILMIWLKVCSRLRASHYVRYTYCDTGQQKS